MNKPKEPISVLLELDNNGNIAIYSPKDKIIAHSKSRGELIKIKKDLISMGALKENEK